jgi:hypothetical protein
LLGVLATDVERVWGRVGGGRPALVLLAALAIGVLRTDVVGVRGPGRRGTLALVLILIAATLARLGMGESTAILLATSDAAAAAAASAAAAVASTRRIFACTRCRFWFCKLSVSRFCSRKLSASGFERVFLLLIALTAFLND